MGDGAGIWRIARDSATLDLNTPYAYILLSRDFAHTSRVATLDDREVGFVIGYQRPDSPETLFIWQIAVDETARGMGLAARMLDHLVSSLVEEGSVRMLETTITDDNVASNRLFASLARRWQTAHTVFPLFESGHFPDDDEHAPEPLHQIGPFTGQRLGDDSP